MQPFPMGIKSSVGFECLRTCGARKFAFGLMDAANVIGQCSFADKRSIAFRTMEVTLLLVHGQHVIAFAAAIRKCFGTLIAG